MTISQTTAIHKLDDALLEGLYHVQSQLSQILDRLSQEDYSISKNERSSIGGHTRHIIEFMQALTDKQDIANYDARKRNLQLESSKEHAQAALKIVIEDIHAVLKKDGADKPVHMVEQLSNTGVSLPILSTLGREIAYTIQHGIHHIYIIKTQAEVYGVALDHDIGVAPATVTYQN